LERRWVDGRMRLTVFGERTNNALISQTTTVTDAGGAQSVQTAISNVAAIRMRGVELSADKDNVLISGLQVFGSVTYVDSRIISDPNWKGPTSVVGKRVPFVPDWRAKFGLTYRPNDSWAYTVAAATAASSIRRWTTRISFRTSTVPLITFRSGLEDPLQCDEEFSVRLRHR